MCTTNGFFVNRGAGGTQGLCRVTYGLNRETGHVFALCHYNKSEPPQTHTKFVCIKSTQVHIRCKRIPFTTHVIMQILSMGHTAPHYGMCNSNEALLQMAKAKCQGRRVLTKLQARQSLKSESWLFIRSNLRLIFPVLSQGVRWVPIVTGKTYKE